MELLLGCGARREKILYREGHQEWNGLVTLDMNANHTPDWLFELGSGRLPFADNTADEIHAYEVLEHVGQQGDWRKFLGEFEDYWRVLKPGGLFFATTPDPTSRWAFGDPGHTRLIPREALTFLDQSEYERQVGVTPMTDYRRWYKGDLRALMSEVDEGKTHKFVLQAHK